MPNDHISVDNAGIGFLESIIMFYIIETGVLLFGILQWECVYIWRGTFIFPRSIQVQQKENVEKVTSSP